MVSRDVIKYRAVKMGIATGRMPNVELIWAVQRSEGITACFGQGRKCNKSNCRWRGECLELENYVESPVAWVKDLTNRANIKPTKRIKARKLTSYTVEREPASAGTIEPSKFSPKGS